MTNTETKRLLAYVYAAKHRFRPSKAIQGRASVKAKAQHKGAILKHSKVIHKVHVETVFTPKRIHITPF